MRLIGVGGQPAVRDALEDPARGALAGLARAAFGRGGPSIRGAFVTYLQQGE